MLDKPVFEALVPIRFHRHDFMEHRNLKVNCDSATFLCTCPRQTLNWSFFIAAWMSLRRTDSGQDNGLCGVYGISMPGTLICFPWGPKQSIFKPGRRNSQIDVVLIGFNSSLSTRTRTTFSVDNISWDCSSSLVSISSWRALSIQNKKADKFTISE